jgi:hypothetical protein
MKRPIAQRPPGAILIQQSDDFFHAKCNNCRQDFLTVDLLFSSNEQFTQVNNRLLSTIEMMMRCLVHDVNRYLKMLHRNTISLVMSTHSSVNLNWYLRSSKWRKFRNNLYSNLAEDFELYCAHLKSSMLMEMIVH